MWHFTQPTRACGPFWYAVYSGSIGVWQLVPHASYVPSTCVQSGVGSTLPPAFGPISVVPWQYTPLQVVVAPSYAGVAPSAAATVDQVPEAKPYAGKRPGSGQPIVLLADHQTTGGYPKIAEVIAADAPVYAARGTA